MLELEGDCRPFSMQTLLTLGHMDVCTKPPAAKRFLYKTIYISLPSVILKRGAGLCADW